MDDKDKNSRIVSIKIKENPSVLNKFESMMSKRNKDAKERKSHHEKILNNSKQKILDSSRQEDDDYREDIDSGRNSGIIRNVSDSNKFKELLGKFNKPEIITTNDVFRPSQYKPQPKPNLNKIEDTNQPIIQTRNSMVQNLIKMNEQRVLKSKLESDLKTEENLSEINKYLKILEAAKENQEVDQKDIFIFQKLGIDINNKEQIEEAIENYSYLQQRAISKIKIDENKKTSRKESEIAPKKSVNTRDLLKHIVTTIDNENLNESVESINSEQNKSIENKDIDDNFLDFMEDVNKDNNKDYLVIDNQINYCNEENQENEAIKNIQEVINIYEERILENKNINKEDSRISESKNDFNNQENKIEDDDILEVNYSIEEKNEVMNINVVNKEIESNELNSNLLIGQKIKKEDVEIFQVEKFYKYSNIKKKFDFIVDNIEHFILEKVNTIINLLPSNEQEIFIKNTNKKYLNLEINNIYEDTYTNKINSFNIENSCYEIVKFYSKSEKFTKLFNLNSVKESQYIYVKEPKILNNQPIEYFSIVGSEKLFSISNYEIEYSIKKEFILEITDQTFFIKSTPNELILDHNCHFNFIHHKKNLELEKEEFSISNSTHQNIKIRNLKNQVYYNIQFTINCLNLVISRNELYYEKQKIDFNGKNIMFETLNGFNMNTTPVDYKEDINQIINDNFNQNDNDEDYISESNV